MANRRQGYGGGGGGGGRSYYNSGPVNPWQGGNMPGNQGGPFNSVNPANLLSQLSEPQAQLALALTNLLQPQQQVPSLLSMNTVGPLRNNTIYRQNNYGPRGGRDMNRRPRSEPKRNEPYKKMHNRRDSDNNRRRPNNANNKSQAQNKSNSNSKSSSSSANTNNSKTAAKVEKATDDTTATASKTVAHDIKEEKPEPLGGTTADSESKDVDNKSADEDNDADVTVKREWKDDGENDESSGGVKKEDANKNDTAKSSEELEDEGSINLKYAGIPATLLHCYICEKKMWDGESFEKHINGRAHQQMFEKHKESYRIKVDMMRQAIRLAEEKNHIELDRMKRLGKKTKSHHMSHCAMCDLDFHGQLFSHRKTSSHQKLKHYLHPRCAYCNKEFPNRMDWEIHRHSIRHLRKEANLLDKKKGKVQPEEDEIEIDDECFVVLDSIENDDEDEPNVVTDITDDLNESEIHMPTYKPKRSVGLSLITSVTGFYCKPCSRFFINEQASKQHAQSKKHFDSFIHVLKEKVAEREAKKRKADAKLDETEEDDGNWKRRKVLKDEKNDDTKDESNAEVNQSAEDEQIQDDDGEEQEEDEGEEEANDDELPENETNEGSELYDPAETFSATDPNDINLNDETLIDKEPMNDEDWKEVDEKLDEILEEEIKAEQETETPPAVVVKEEPKEKREPKEKEAPKETPKKEVIAAPVKTSTPAPKPKVNQARKTRARKN